MSRALILIQLAVFLCCRPTRHSVIIAGSTSIQPFMEKLAEHFMEKYPGIQVDVQGGGSTAGIQATFNRTCNIGMSSRNLKVHEHGLKVLLIAVDGIAVIVHKSNPVENLSVDVIRDIFTDRVRNWQGLSGEDALIIPVTREEGSGTRGAFEEMIMGDEMIGDACLVQDSNGAVREIIATTPQGIGYISVGLVDQREKAVAVDGIKPTLANLITNKYRFSRPFLLLLMDEPVGDVKQFIDYVLSSEGQDILRGAGLIPAADVAFD